jgi:[ribosomal protein S18]-alanine N-acetyltransferase
MNASAPLVFRPALAADVPDLVAIDASSPGGGWQAQAFLQELGLAWSHVEVASCPAAPASIAGFLVYWLVAGEAELLDVAIHPDLRRRGLGRALLRRLEDVARAQAVGRIILEVRRSNGAARQLYAALGFVENGVRRGYYQDNREDAILMEWLLAAEEDGAGEGSAAGRRDQP